MYAQEFLSWLFVKHFGLSSMLIQHQVSLLVTATSCKYLCMMELTRVVFISLVFLCGVRDAHADTNLTDLTGQVRVLTASIQAWKGRVVNIKTDMKGHFRRWESSLKNQLTDTFIPALIKPLVEQAITGILKEYNIRNIMRGRILGVVNRLRVSVHYTKTQLRTVTQQFRRVERERDSYKESMFKLRSEVNTDIHSLQLQLNETKAGLRDANMVNSVLQEDLITLNTSCVKREEIEAHTHDEQSYRKGLQEMQQKLKTDIQSLNIQQNQTIDDLHDSNQVITGLTEDMVILNTSCVKREDIEAHTHDEQSYRKGLQEMQQKLKTDIQSLNIQQNQTIDDLHDSNQVITGLTEDMVTLNTSCVKREEIEAHTHDEQSYRKELQEMQQKLKTDIQSLNIQQNQTIDDLHASNQVITGLTEDMVTLNTSCVKREDIKEVDVTDRSLTTSSLSQVSFSTSPPSFPGAAGASSDRSHGERAAQMTTVTTHASTDPSQTARTAVTTSKKPATQATPSPADCWDLHDASSDGNLEEVKRILSQGVDVDCRRWRSWTPVMRAAYMGHRDVVELLVSEGADVSLVDGDGSNTLHFACVGGHLETVKFVLSLHVVDIDARDNYGRTAADEARLGGHTRVLDLLVSRGAQ
ncbi:protein HOS4-like isoform X2 [Haliotis rufescens]|uniref:protein HOS4-like isoform X2 n=1 Tax=Haliotis rufescens TaxID=6454 RepID=UPI00201EE98A|nr:protein HOS4-like isoform X2 [Haliotis rufescens]